MKVPPVPAERLAPAISTVKSERDRSFLIFAGIVLVAIAFGFKSELLGQGQVWALALGLVVVAAPALLGYLRGSEEVPRIEHYIPVALGAVTLAAVPLYRLPPIPPCPGSTSCISSVSSMSIVAVSRTVATSVA